MCVRGSWGCGQCPCKTGAEGASPSHSCTPSCQRRLKLREEVQPLSPDASGGNKDILGRGKGKFFNLGSSSCHWKRKEPVAKRKGKVQE